MNGLQYYINNANTRFTNLLFPDNEKRISGLARIDVRTGMPFVKSSGNNYVDALFDNSYDLTLFYVETGDRKVLPYGFDASVDLVVCCSMDKFTSYEEEEIIEAVYEVFKKTSFRIESINRDSAALEGFEYTEKIKETMLPYFVFRIKTKITGILKQM